ncbi:MAG: peptidoglycan DD-metalloendopeptidase family protein [Staphylococcus pseudoxylosus]|uniref:peptidoglycan DD-metalloendopeptidase family protein n=1 Tax=Staphylococcus pseudoxylosus TaxID=2282419 RepID=UPI0031F5FFC9
MAEDIRSMRIEMSMKDMGIERTVANIKKSFNTLKSEVNSSNKEFTYGEKSIDSYKKHISQLEKAQEASEKNLKDMTREYHKVGDEQGYASDKALGLQKSITEQEKELHFLSRSLKQTNDDLVKFKEAQRIENSPFTKVANQFKSVSESMGKVSTKMTDIGSSMTNKITKPALVAGAAMGGITAKLGFDRLVGLDTAKAKLEGLGYSTKEVGSITDQVTKAIDGGMTTMAEGTDVAAGALAAGVDEGKDLEKYIKLVGDAAVGSNRPVGEMAQIFNRVQGQGKLMTQELNMVEEGMPGFSNAMAKHMGVSYDAFRDMVTNGEVKSEEFLTVMDDFAGGMAEAYSGSWQGMVQNSKAYIGQIGEAMLSGTFEQAKGSLHEFEKLLRSPGAQKWAKETGEKLANTFNTISNGIKTVVKWWQGLDGSTQKTLGGIVKWLGITLVTMGPVLTIFGKFVGTIGKMFGGLSTVIGWLVKYNAASKVSAAATGIWNGVTATARGIANGYRYAIAALTTSQTAQAVKSKLAAAATVIWTGVTKAATLATKGLGLAIKFMTGPVGIVITAITALVGIVIHLWKTNDTFRNAVIKIWNSIKSGIMTSVNFLRKAVPAVWNAIKDISIKVWTAVKNGVVNLVKLLVNGVKAYINLVKKVVTTVFNAVKSFAIKVWTTIKDKIVNFAKLIWKGLKIEFAILKKVVTTVFNAVKNFSIKVWTTIKNSVVKLAKLLWNGVKNTFNTLKKGVSTIFNAVKNFVVKLWTSIKNKVINLAKALWQGVRDKFNALKKSVNKIISDLRNYVVNKWKNLKQSVVYLATGAKDGVVKGFKAMYDKGVEWLNKLKSFITNAKKGFKKVATDLGKGVANGAISGLNAMIDGINWLSDKIMSKKLIKNKVKKLSTGTGANPDVSTDSEGRLTKSTKAIVNDKGLGNAKGPNGHKEIIQRRNGKIEKPSGRNKRVNLRRGDAVYNGVQSKAYLSTGTGADLLKRGKKHKHGEEVHGDMYTPKNSGNGGGSGWDFVVDKTGKAYNGTKDALKAAKDKVGKAIGDVWEYAKSPGKLINKVLKQFGVDFSSVKGAMGGVMDFGYKGLKKQLKELVTGWFDDSGDGDSGYLDLSRGINFGFAKTAAEAKAKGYPFPRPHHGIDINYPYGSKVQSTVSGKATGTHGYNGGFGNMMSIKSGIMEVIYGHLSKLNWTGTRSVKPGDVLGKSGGDPSKQGANAGDSTGPHLHYEMRWNGTPKDPMDWLKKNNGGGSAKKSASKWKSDIRKAAKEMGVSVSKGDVNGIASLINAESGGDAGVTQNPALKDGNSGANLAQGLLQYVPSTFKAYAKKGHTNIKSGYDQLLAFFNNKNWKSDYNPNGGWGPTGARKFATGGIIRTDGLYNLAEDGHEEVMMSMDPKRATDTMKLMGYVQENLRGKDNNKRPNQVPNRYGNSSSNSNSREIELMAQQIERQDETIDVLKQMLSAVLNIEKQPKGTSERDISKQQGKKAIMESFNSGGAFV